MAPRICLGKAWDGGDGKEADETERRRQEGPQLLNMSEAAKVGRPSKYNPAFCEIAHTLAAEGATDVEIADALEIHVATYYRFKAEHPEFREATQLGKEAADDRVEVSLFHRAVGYTHDAVKIFMPAGASAPVMAPYREHFPPDTAAASLWLRNRRPDKWRDKVEQVHGVTSELGELLRAIDGKTRGVPVK